MAKILISFVGTGGLINRETQGKSYLDSKRQYRKTVYHLGDENLGEYSFVAAALAKSHNVDKVILIGTTHSMWEEVYRYFSEQNNKGLDQDTFHAIAEHCDRATHESELTIPHKDKIERALGGDSHVLLIRYGLNEKEITENISIVLGLDSLINTGDEIIVDVTHSFRSLPIFIMNLLLYLTNVSSKNPKISHIYYGMLEMYNSMHYAPIVDLNKILELNKWIVGASAFKNYGNAYQICELMKGKDSQLVTQLANLSNVLNLNHLNKLEGEVEKMKKLKDKDYSDPLPELTVKPVVDDFLKEFGTATENHALFQYTLAKWQFKNMNYALSLLSLAESIITYACIKANKGWEAQKDREKVKEEIRKKKSSLPVDLLDCYEIIRKLRNGTAHNLQMEYKPQTIINKLDTALKTVGRYIHN